MHRVWRQHVTSIPDGILEYFFHPFFFIIPSVCPLHPFLFVYSSRCCQPAFTSYTCMKVLINLQYLPPMPSNVNFSPTYCWPSIYLPLLLTMMSRPTDKVHALQDVVLHEIDQLNQPRLGIVEMMVDVRLPYTAFPYSPSFYNQDICPIIRNH